MPLESEIRNWERTGQPPAEFEQHSAVAGSLILIGRSEEADAFDRAAAENNRYRHCRIGRIRVKRAT